MDNQNSTTSQQLTTSQSDTDISAAAEKALVVGDLSNMPPNHRIRYYMEICKSLGINPLTKPFEYLELPDGRGGRKTILYVKREGTEQLRYRDNISVAIINREYSPGGKLYIVHARATAPNGRTDESIGVVPLTDKRDQLLVGEQLSNALMRAETKAKRRVTLSIVGLGFPDESEIGSIDGARRVSLEEAHGDQRLLPEQVTSEDDLPAYVADSTAAPEETITGAQHRRLEARINELSLDRDRVKVALSNAFGIAHLTDILKSDYERVDRLLERWQHEPISEAQAAEIRQLADGVGISDINAWLQSHYGTPVPEKVLCSEFKEITTALKAGVVEQRSTATEADHAAALRRSADEDYKISPLDEADHAEALRQAFGEVGKSNP